MTDTILNLEPSPGERARSALGRRNLVLVGLMGAGKSAIGRLVAQQMGLPFIDTDVEIERVSRMTIPELFEAYGEAKARLFDMPGLGDRVFNVDDGFGARLAKSFAGRGRSWLTCRTAAGRAAAAGCAGFGRHTGAARLKP